MNDYTFAVSEIPHSVDRNLNGGETAPGSVCRVSRALASLSCLLWLASSAAADEDVHWTYSGEHGPEHWGELSEVFEACSDGRNQSPIDIVDPRKAKLGPIALSYGGSTTSVIDNGHTIQVEVSPGNSLEMDGRKYALVQFHLHSPSEHQIDGKSFPLEAHFVHENERGELAVVAVLFHDGPHHPGLATIGTRAFIQAGKSHSIDVPIAELGIVPEGRTHYRYSGSLTTPPCTEGVLWLILKDTSSVSKEQVATFVKMIGEDARGAQPLNGRLVVH
jgi:carbonic anhydrase